MNRDMHELLAVSSIRKLWALRRDPRDGEEARKAIRRWCQDLRALRAQP